MRIRHFLLVTALLWGLPAQICTAGDEFVACPSKVVARFGGFEGWSSIGVQANFAKALVDEQHQLITCQYGFGSKPEPFFGIQKPCPTGFRCVVEGYGFRLWPQKSEGSGSNSPSSLLPSYNWDKTMTINLPPQ